MLFSISFQTYFLFTPTCNANVAAAHSVLSNILPGHAPGQVIIVEILLEKLLVFGQLQPAPITEAIWERAVVDGEPQIYFFPHFTFKVHSHFPLTSWFVTAHTHTSPKLIMTLRLHSHNAMMLHSNSQYYFIDYNFIRLWKHINM